MREPWQTLSDSVITMLLSLTLAPFKTRRRDMSTCFMLNQTQGGIHVPYSVLYQSVALSTPTANEEGGKGLQSPCPELET